MKIEYKFVNGEKVSIEVYGKLEEIMLELDKNLKSNDRKETRRHENLSLLDKDVKNIDLSADPFEEVLKNLDNEKLHKAISKLKSDEKELIHKIYLNKNHWSQLECAQLMNVSENTVKQRLKRIRKKLKIILFN